MALQQKEFNPLRAIQAFQQYIKYEDKYITREMFEENLANKMKSILFTEDINPILSDGINWDIYLAAKEVQTKLALAFIIPIAITALIGYFAITIIAAEASSPEWYKVWGGSKDDWGQDML